MQAALERLAYERLQHTRRIEEIDTQIKLIEGGNLINEEVSKDIQLIETIEKAKEEKPSGQVIQEKK